eukprot:CAMPEP_0197853058 /NCGR_PEP_ID=MMETSP1438-20131217/21989_1 /TAXON_ID=1461541 /ORGANISM="Pterosperma sp., Strain CCMP1384" /LENGTH=50 /DNA_ID=CAMNT_0043467335 /DNA_START=296 /DNA_END=445 /DNA_ORIENTATION=-
MRSGVRCADTMLTSHFTPKSFRVLQAWPMTLRSESDPMITATSAPSDDSA